MTKQSFQLRFPKRFTKRFWAAKVCKQRPSDLHSFAFHGNGSGGSGSWPRLPMFQQFQRWRSSRRSPAKGMGIVYSYYKVWFREISKNVRKNIQPPAFLTVKSAISPSSIFDAARLCSTGHTCLANGSCLQLYLLFIFFPLLILQEEILATSWTTSRTMAIVTHHRPRVMANSNAVTHGRQ